MCLGDRLGDRELHLHRRLFAGVRTPICSLGVEEGVRRISLSGISDPGDARKERSSSRAADLRAAEIGRDGSGIPSPSACGACVSSRGEEFSVPERGAAAAGGRRLSDCGDGFGDQFSRGRDEVRSGRQAIPEKRVGSRSDAALWRTSEPVLSGLSPGKRRSPRKAPAWPRLLRGAVVAESSQTVAPFGVHSNWISKPAPPAPTIGEFIAAGVDAATSSGIGDPEQDFRSRPQPVGPEMGSGPIQPALAEIPSLRHLIRGLPVRFPRAPSQHNSRRQSQESREEWPVLGFGVVREEEWRGIPFAEVVRMSGDGGQGNWRPGPPSGFGGGAGDWNQGRGGPMNWIPQGYVQQGPGYGQFMEGQGFGRGAPFMDPRAPAAGAGMFPPMETWNRPPVPGFNNQQPGNQSFNPGMRAQGPNRGLEQNPQQFQPRGGSAAKSVSSGSTGSLQSSGTGKNTSAGTEKEKEVDGTKSVLGGKANGCYRCGEPGHIAKDCKAILFCINCGKNNVHLSSKCVMATRPQQSVKLVGCAQDGLQMMVATSGKRGEKNLGKQTTGLVTLVKGSLDASQLAAAFNKQFSWGADWKVSAYGEKEFLVSFPNEVKLEEMSSFECFGLRGTPIVIRVVPWSLTAAAKFKLTSVWVRVTGVPPSMLNKEGFDEVGSMLGTVQELDMPGFWEHKVIRIRVGVRDHTKIPQIAPLTEDPYIYHICFEVEEVVEKGGPIVNGIVIHMDEPAMGSMFDDGAANRTNKRSKNNSAGSFVNSPNQDKNKQAGGERDEEEVESSQAELDRQLEQDLRRKMLSGKNKSGNQNREGPVIGDPGDVDMSVDDGDQGDEEEDDEKEEDKMEDRYSIEDADLEEDAETFARKMGFSTQAINDLDKEKGGPSQEPADKEGENEKEAQDKKQTKAAKGKNKAKLIDDAVDEARRRSVRHNTEANTMEKAVDLAKKKNLETGPEEKSQKQATSRSAGANGGGLGSVP